MRERSTTPWRSFDEWCDQALIEVDYPNVRVIPQIRMLLQGAWNAGRITARSETAALAPASAYVLAIQQSVGSILSQYSANKILDRAKEIANGH